MLDDPAHLHHALDAVDAVVGNLGPLPAPVAAMLFQRETDGSGGTASLTFHAAATCPKLGVLLTVEGDHNPLTAPLPDKQFSCLEAYTSTIDYSLSPLGKAAAPSAEPSSQSGRCRRPSFAVKPNRREPSSMQWHELMWHWQGSNPMSFICKWLFVCRGDASDRQIHHD